MFAHLLVPLDGSAFAEKALPYALALAAKFDAEITLLRVVPYQFVATEFNRDSADMLLQLREAALAEAEAYLIAHQGTLRQQGYVVHQQAIAGEQVAELIINTVTGLDVDAIVMSTHGRSGVNRWVFGSVAERILRHASVPVLMVRPLAIQES